MVNSSGKTTMEKLYCSRILIDFLVALISAVFSLQTFASKLPELTQFGSESVRLYGELYQGGVVIGETLPGAEVLLDNKELSLSLSGRFAFGFGRDAKLNHKLKVTLPNKQIEQFNLVLKKRDYRIQKISGISKKIMHPSNKNLGRIKKETKAVRQARNGLSKREDFFGDFDWPLTGPITGVYGSQRVYNDVPKRPHFGVDVAAPVGTKVRAPQSGRVTLADDLFYSGGTVIIDHGYGINTSFLHMSKVLVSEGQEIKKGDVIGLVGKKGRATGAHLDWRLNWFQTRMDASYIVGKMPKHLSSK